jgi:hypothetical protein
LVKKLAFRIVQSAITQDQVLEPSPGRKKQGTRSTFKSEKNPQTSGLKSRGRFVG